MHSTVELREIRAFLTLAETLHFARAAGQLGINASRVSQTIAELESRLGVKLFDRTSRRVALTPAGRQLLERLAPAYHELQDALDETARQALGPSGTLRIGMYTRALGGPHLVEMMDRFNAGHPGWTAAYVDTGVRDYLAVLRAGEVDMLAARLPLSDPEFTVGPVLTREPRIMLVSRGHRLAGRETIRHEDLADETVTDVVVFPKQMMDAFFPSVTSSGRRIRRVNCPSLEQLMFMVAAGRMVHPTVPSFLDYLSHPGVVAVPVADLPPAETALVWLTADRRAAIGEFVQVAEAVLESAAWPAPLVPDSA